MKVVRCDECGSDVRHPFTVWTVREMNVEEQHSMPTDPEKDFCTLRCVVAWAVKNQHTDANVIETR